MKSGSDGFKIQIVKVRPVECNFDFKPYFYGAQAETVNVLAESAFFLGSIYPSTGC
jgi:hypothetical protein